MARFGIVGRFDGRTFVGQFLRRAEAEALALGLGEANLIDARSIARIPGFRSD